jgi:hypothetical protein
MAILDYSAIYNYTDNSLPNDLAIQRRHCWEYHYTFGMPVVLRTVYDQDAVAEGLASVNPTYDPIYEQALTWSGADGGAGYGYGPPIFTYITLGDSIIDDQTPSEIGVFKQFMPNMSAPWAPHIKDGDLIISVIIHYDNNGSIVIDGTGDRYVVQQVQPVTMRSLFRQNSIYLENNYNYPENTDIIVQQNMQAVRIERTNPIYNISVTGEDA